MNETRVPVYAAHVGGSSVQDLLHFSQACNSDSLPYFDFGSSGNEAHYHQDTPPNYNLSAFPAHAPGLRVMFASGSGDNFADPADVAHAARQLGAQVTSIYVDGYTHLDFIWAIDAHKKLYPQVIDFINGGK